MLSHLYYPLFSYRYHCHLLVNNRVTKDGRIKSHRFHFDHFGLETYKGTSSVQHGVEYKTIYNSPWRPLYSEAGRISISNTPRADQLLLFFILDYLVLSQISDNDVYRGTLILYLHGALQGRGMSSTRTSYTELYPTFRQTHQSILLIFTALCHMVFQCGVMLLTQTPYLCCRM